MRLRAHLSLVRRGREWTCCFEETASLGWIITSNTITLFNLNPEVASRVVLKEPDQRGLRAEEDPGGRPEPHFPRLLVRTGLGLA